MELVLLPEGYPSKTGWDRRMEDMNSFGPSREGAWVQNKWRRKNQGATDLTRVYLENAK